MLLQFGYFLCHTYFNRIVKTDAIDQLLDLHIPLEDRINYAGSAHGQLLSAITRYYVFVAVFNLLLII